VLARYARNQRLSDAIYLRAFAAITASPGARACYDTRRAAGDSHHAALRALGNRRPWTLAQLELMSAALHPRYAVLPYLGAGTGMRQAEMFGLAITDIDLSRPHPVVHVRRQVRVIDGRRPCDVPPGCDPP